MKLGDFDPEINDFCATQVAIAALLSIRPSWLEHLS